MDYIIRIHSAGRDIIFNELHIDWMNDSFVEGAFDAIVTGIILQSLGSYLVKIWFCFKE